MCTCVRVRDSRGRKWNIDEGVKNILRSRNSQALSLFEIHCVFSETKEMEPVYHPNILSREEERLHFS